MNIYIVGFMGTGKSAVGKEVARRKKWRFADLDELIELKEKRLISDIFAKDGEPAFRRIEKQMLKKVSLENKFVISCGGGIVLDKANIRIMKDTGIIICLKASLKEILRRVSGSAHRPLLNVSGQKQQIEALLKYRAPFYAQADKMINTTGLSVKEVAEKIIRIKSRKDK